MQNQQLQFNALNPSVERHEVNSFASVRSAPLGFNFSGRIKNPTNHRKGQFQYRFGRKVCPPDFSFPPTVKKTGYASRPVNNTELVLQLTNGIKHSGRLAMLAVLLLSASANAVDTGSNKVGKPAFYSKNNNNATVSHVADAIFRAEGTHSKHPYGVMIPCTDPRRICLNTINHAWVDFGREQQLVKLPADDRRSAVSLPFISFLGQRYCPPSVDAIGYQHWTNNVYRILNAKR